RASLRRSCASLLRSGVVFDTATILVQCHSVYGAKARVPGPVSTAGWGRIPVWRGAKDWQVQLHWYMVRATVFEQRTTGSLRTKRSDPVHPCRYLRARRGAPGLIGHHGLEVAHDEEVCT